jgi:hypothetical protein
VGFLPPYVFVRCAPSPQSHLALSPLFKKEKIRQKSQKNNKIRENDLSFSYSSTASGDRNVS